MIKSGHKQKPNCWAIKLAACLLTVSLIAIPSSSWAHSFTVALHVVGDDQPTALASAIRELPLSTFGTFQYVSFVLSPCVGC
jgi:hypothetical protein